MLEQINEDFDDRSERRQRKIERERERQRGRTRERLQLKRRLEKEGQDDFSGDGSISPPKRSIVRAESFGTEITKVKTSYQDDKVRRKRMLSMERKRQSNAKHSKLNERNMHGS